MTPRPQYAASAAFRENPMQTIQSEWMLHKQFSRNSIWFIAPAWLLPSRSRSKSPRNSGKVTRAEMASIVRFHGIDQVVCTCWRVTKTWLHFQFNDRCSNLKEESLSMLIFYDPFHVSRKLFRCFHGNTTVTK